MVTHVFTVLFYVKMAAVLYSVFVYTAMSRCAKRNRIEMFYCATLAQLVECASHVQRPCHRGSGSGFRSEEITITR